jgi:ribosomal protein S10
MKKIFNLFIKTKNKIALKNFLLFLNKNMDKNFNLIKKKFKKKKKKIVFTVLKSPHVNKSAQEQFEMNFMSFQLTISTTQVFKILIFLKKLKNSIFADITFKINFFTNSKKYTVLRKKLFDIDNFKIYLNVNENFSLYIYKVLICTNNEIKLKNSSNSIENTVKHYIQIIDFYSNCYVPLKNKEKFKTFNNKIMYFYKNQDRFPLFLLF